MNIINKLFTKKITITKEADQTIIDIKKDCSLEEYNKTLKKSKYSYLLELINIKHLLTQDQITKRKILIISKKDITYIISIEGNNILIEKQDIKEQITNHFISISNNTITKVSTLTHTIEGSTIKTKMYNKDNPTNLKEFSLSKKEALQIVSTTLEELSNIEDIYSYLNISEILDNSNIILNKNYFPVINNDVITLSWPNRYGSTTISNKIRASLDIILNSTREKIGEITFTYLYNPNLSYTGNVGYHIKDEFQNNHYATIALSLLKELLKNHQYYGNKDLYISTDIHNIRSQKVALNNEGELYYDGEIPKSDSLSRHSGISHVKIYKIKI